MNQSDRLTAFEAERDALNHDFLNDLIEPETMELLAHRLSDKYALLARTDEEVTE